MLELNFGGGDPLCNVNVGAVNGGCNGCSLLILRWMNFRSVMSVVCADLALFLSFSILLFLLFIVVVVGDTILFVKCISRRGGRKVVVRTVLALRTERSIAFDMCFRSQWCAVRFLLKYAASADVFFVAVCTTLYPICSSRSYARCLV